MELHLEFVEEIVGKRGNAVSQHFFPFSTIYSILFWGKVVKTCNDLASGYICNLQIRSLSYNTFFDSFSPKRKGRHIEVVGMIFGIMINYFPPKHPKVLYFENLNGKYAKCAMKLKIHVCTGLAEMPIYCRLSIFPK